MNSPCFAYTRGIIVSGLKEVYFLLLSLNTISPGTEDNYEDKNLLYY